MKIVSKFKISEDFSVKFISIIINHFSSKLQHRVNSFLSFIHILFLVNLSEEVFFGIFNKLQ